MTAQSLESGRPKYPAGAEQHGLFEPRMPNGAEWSGRWTDRASCLTREEDLRENPLVE